MKLIKQIREEREFLHKMMKYLVEDRSVNEYWEDAANGVSRLYKYSATHFLTMTVAHVVLVYAVAGLFVLVVKLLRREL